MTLPKNVEDALSLLDRDDGSCLEIEQVAIIRAHLMSQEAEIGRLQAQLDDTSPGESKT